MDLSIVIPCYNEIDNIPTLRDEFFPVVASLAETRLVEVIFVDDGSTDGTGDGLTRAFADGSQWGVTVKIERHKPNQGLGAAIRTGFAASRGEIVITTDSDGTYRFTEILAMLSHLTSDVDLITASPYHPSGDVAGVPGYRLLLSRGSSTLYRLLTSRQVHTYTALFRAYRREVIENVPFESNGFLAGTELLVNALRMGYQVAEYPAVLHSRVCGESKAKIARTIRAHLNFQVQTLLPWQPYGTVIQGSDECVYLYLAGQKCLFPSADIFSSHGYAWEQIVQVNDSFLAGLPDGPSLIFRDGTLVQGAGETVYVIEHVRKRPIPTAQIFEKLGYRWENILDVADDGLAELETGSPLSITGKHPDGTVVKGAFSEFAYLLEDGKKRWFPSPQIFLSWGYKWSQIVTIPEQELAGYPSGPDITAQSSFYLQDIQDAISVNLRDEEVPAGGIFSKLPQLFDSFSSKKHVKELPGVNRGRRVLKTVF